ncbi:MAG: biotin/lipoyl-binding protein [Sinobacteraceae bacterium]|nr:biotin/lipoyl-binding protein [Nevskiaceae bacterium]
MKSLLVANRGEIACRIFRTAKRLGIRTIAVFSDADRTARHVREADEAVWIGPAAPRESYLNVARILDAARVSGAQAIHPGYGFLSENAAFAQACVDAGLLFVGPPSSAIAAMGSKIVAKARMRAAGVPVLPGYEGDNQDLEHLHGEARRLGMPLIIKPAAGGGGKGMRIVRDPEQIPEALAAARRLAESGFGDGSLLLERFLPAPRHVEVQIFADTHGNFVHLGDRDCSIQRRHQKLIEEAPAPALPDEVRERLRAAALIVGREIGYISAGTVEFLFDGREFYFMEMNTRLQVEHTVTERVTGLDLVEWQLRVASGERLPLAQAQIRLSGHAIEARVCAEDPEADFLPSAGELRLLEWPREEQVRVDAGFATGDRVPESYDSLLGKVIAWAPSRNEAAARLRSALEHTYCAGIRTNERWLARILANPRFLEVSHSIAFLEANAQGLQEEARAAQARFQQRATVLAALALRADWEHQPRSVSSAAIQASACANATIPGLGTPWAARDGFTPNLPAIVQFTLQLRGQQYPIEIESGVSGSGACAQTTLAAGAVSVTVDKVSCVVTDVAETEDVIAACVDGIRTQARAFVYASRVHVWLATEHYDFVHEDPRSKQFSASASTGDLTTPLPGVVAAVAVASGQQVAAGEVLMVIEAMKMEHAITAPFAGTVQSIHFARGDRVPEGSTLLELVPQK